MSADEFDNGAKFELFRNRIAEKCHIRPQDLDYLETVDGTRVVQAILEHTGCVLDPGSTLGEVLYDQHILTREEADFLDDEAYIAEEDPSGSWWCGDLREGAGARTRSYCSWWQHLDYACGPIVSQA